MTLNGFQHVISPDVKWQGVKRSEHVKKQYDVTRWRVRKKYKSEVKFANP
jgi:hypothetical protein